LTRARDRTKVSLLDPSTVKEDAMSKLLAALAKAPISVTAMDAVTAGKGRFGAIFWVKPKAVAKTAKLLGAR